MQSGDAQRGVGAAGRPPGRSTSSASASPSSSSSAVSAPHPGFDAIQQQQQHHHQQQQQLQLQQQQLAFRQSLQQLRKPEGDEALLSYQAGGIHGVMGGSNFPSSSGSMLLPQQSRKFIDLSQQHGGSQTREESQNKGQGSEQHMQNPMHQAYVQYALQAAQQKSVLGNMQQHQQGKLGMVGPPTGKDQDMRMGNMKMQNIAAIQAANQAQASASKKSVEHFVHGERQVEQGPQPTSDQRGESKALSQGTLVGQLMSPNVIRPVQASQTQPSIQNIANNQFAMAQLQAMQAWALENNIDLSQPNNAQLIAQLLPIWQSRMAGLQKTTESNAGAPSSRQQTSKQQIISSPPIVGESSVHANSSSDVSGQSGSVKPRQMVPSGAFSNSATAVMGNANNIQMQQLGVHNRQNQSPRQQIAYGNGMPPPHPPQSSVNTSQGLDNPHTKSTSPGAENLQMQYLRQLPQLNRSSPQSVISSNDNSAVTHSPSQGGAAQMPHPRLGFTKQQLHVLKAQILAFRRLKRGEGSLPQEVLRAIAPPPLELQLQQVLVPPQGTTNNDRSLATNVEEHARNLESNDKAAQAIPSTRGLSLPKEESSTEEKATTSAGHVQGVTTVMKETMRMSSVGKEELQNTSLVVKPEQEVERGTFKIAAKNDHTADKGKAVPSQVAVSDAGQIKKPVQASTVPQPKEVGPTRKYHGPLFDFPFFTKKHDSFGSAMGVNNMHNLTLAYDVKDLLFEEGIEVLNKKRTENLKKIGGLLAVNLERKRIRPDLVLRLQIEERKLRLLDLQARVRDEVDQQQQEIMAMPDRPYRKFVRLCERQRMDLARQVQLSQKMMREKQLKSIFQWRKKLLEAHWAIRDARTARNRGVAKYHERMLREFSKRKDDDRNKRMEALKNNDVDRYREMLLEQQTSIQGDAAQRYAVLSSFLSQTEEYLHKLGGKITATKNQQEAVEAAAAAAAAARAQGLSEEEVKNAAACAGEEVMIRNRFSKMNAPKDSSSVNKYYNLAHAVNERIMRQPSMLRAGTLRDYQLVGLQWMLSLYNNKLNGILADEMGLGKTVQVMALIAYLMEFKGNYGPHLIIVPNAVLVNWKSELHNWLPSVSCIFYVGAKDQRSKLFSQEVCAMKFNVLVTTYEFIMYDRSKLSKIDWKYIIIDEAQRMKDRESVLARDLDRYRCQRRLLLTGTPLQNDLKELWSLLNLLLPEVFDNRKAFHDWFSKPFQKDVPTHDAEDDWLETEKKVIIIHRLHQILEPFMLRRRVEDVEGSLPPKVSIVLRCRMSAFQGAIYDWIKSTGTLRVDPEDELRRIQKNPNYQAKKYKTLNNRCMELRKTCNHPLLNYPYFQDFSKDFLIRSCGKLWILDRILIKLQRTGHRVLLFSTMTKLLDILEEYLQWRRLVYRRIDGTTCLDDRESAIVDFNSPNSDCFIFLLSIRAAGRGLNLQSADTVVIYDPDPNPKNEEQAVARAHRIGQKREVKVIYMEAVVDKISSHQKEDELRSGGTVDLEDDLAGKDRYMGSIESLIRNNIQQYKIDMADEVINAGRFDQRTTHEERRMTLETLLHDEERYQETVHDVPSLQKVNRMIARSEEEVELFDQMDEELDWNEEMTRYDQVPDWLRASTKEVNAAVANLSKKPTKNILSGSMVVESSEMVSDLSPIKTERKRGRPKGSNGKKFTSYRELDDEGEFSEASSEERNGYSLREEDGEIGEFEDEECSGAVGPLLANKDQSEEDGPACDGGYEYPRALEGTRNNHIFEEAGSSGSSSENRRLTQTVSPSISSQKFGSLSALDARPGSVSKRMPEELEEGEIAVSGDSHMDIQQSGSWTHDRDDGEGEQVLQPKIKRKRSIRVRPRHTSERLEERSSTEKPFLQRGNSSQLVFHGEHDYEAQLRTDPEVETCGEPAAPRQDLSDSISKKRNLPSRRVGNSSKPQAVAKSSRLNCMVGPAEDATEQSRENWDGKSMNTIGPACFGAKIPDLTQRKFKNVINKLQRRIDKEGHQIVPLLTDFWKRNEGSNYLSNMAGSNLLDLRRIDQRVDRLEYSGVMEFVADMQSMLKNVIQYTGLSYEVRSEARKVLEMFFEIMRIAFPDTDLREARNAVLLSLQGTTSMPSPKQGSVGQNKRHKQINDVEVEPSPSARLLSRGPASVDEDSKTRGHISKLQKESTRLGSSSSSREQGQLDESPMLTHPGELVICKKKRKDRDKGSLKSRTNSPVSPPSVGRGVRTPGPGHGPGPGPGPIISPKDMKVSQSTPHHGWPHQPTQQANGVVGGGGSLGWAKPVKRMRTDTGKRRPSHL
ncbi:ATP-dependent helicase BRM [Telopea speciosissima]|uniref:ATP-dependent helicase BRM n=1 Tax=Telopea speciosissima TaxID=54955 RepID=UPI001CC7F111|nr:ATP-dependent helicase BRM [Telopea speciosissima]